MSKIQNNLGMETLWPPGGSYGDDSGMIADILFVHGLWGGRESTWMEDGTLWPKTLLAKDFKNARIMTYGYYADPVEFFGPNSNTTVTALAQLLNNKLLASRSGRTKQGEERSTRPLIIFAHSLGGLVVKDALFQSYRAKERARNERSNANNQKAFERVEEFEALAAIKTSTEAGAVFFAGTPHRGSSKADATKFFLGFETVFGTSKKVVAALKPNSEILMRLMREFAEILNDFSIYTFIEQREYKKGLGVIVDESSALIASQYEKPIFINANHINMVKFSIAEDYRYIQIKDEMDVLFRRLVKRKQGLQNVNRSASKTNTEATEGNELVFWRTKGRRHRPIARSSNHDSNSGAHVLPILNREAASFIPERIELRNKINKLFEEADICIRDGPVRDAEQHLKFILKIIKDNQDCGLGGIVNAYEGLVRCELQKTYITNRSKAKKLRNLQRASYFAREAVVEEEMIRSEELGMADKRS